MCSFTHVLCIQENFARSCAGKADSEKRTIRQNTWCQTTFNFQIEKWKLEIVKCKKRTPNYKMQNEIRIILWENFNSCKTSYPDTARYVDADYAIDF